jgi:hypothetical protein
MDPSADSITVVAILILVPTIYAWLLRRSRSLLERWAGGVLGR